jgi:hypothetical protein
MPTPEFKKTGTQDFLPFFANETLLCLSFRTYTRTCFDFDFKLKKCFCALALKGNQNFFKVRDISIFDGLGLGLGSAV